MIKVKHLVEYLSKLEDQEMEIAYRLFSDFAEMDLNDIVIDELYLNSTGHLTGENYMYAERKVDLPKKKFVIFPGN